MKRVTFSTILRDLRERAGLTQQELADRLGITAHKVGYREGAKLRQNDGDRRFSLDELQEWAEACGSSLAVVEGAPVDLTAAPRDALQVVGELIQSWGSLTERERGMVRALIQQASEDT